MISPRLAAALASPVNNLAKYEVRCVSRLCENSGCLTQGSLHCAFELIVPSDANLVYGDGVGYASVRNEGSSFVALGHGGSFPGYIASYEFDVKADTGVILLANTNHGKANYKVLTRNILALLHPNSGGSNAITLLEHH